MAIAHAGSVTGTAGGSSTSVVSGSFTPANDEVLIVSFYTREEQTNLPTLSGGSLTYTQVDEEPASGSGSDGHTHVFRAVVSGSPGNMTVTANYDSGSTAAIVVNRYTGADTTTPTDATGTATNTGSVKTFTINITTNNDNSQVVSSLGAAVLWNSGDEPANFTFRAGADSGGLSSAKSTLGTADRSTTTAGAYNHTWSDASFHSDNRGVAIELNEDAGGGGGANPKGPFGLALHGPFGGPV